MSAMLPDEATLCTLTVLKGIGPLRLLAAALESSNRFWEDLARNFFCVAGRGLFLGSCGAFAEERGCKGHLFTFVSVSSHRVLPTSLHPRLPAARAA